MKRFYIKVFVFVLTLWLFFCSNIYTNADNVEWLTITQRLTEWEAKHTNRRIRFLWTHAWEFWDNYQKAHQDLNFWERLASGILQIDDILNYMVFVVWFLSQLWIVTWTIFIMYAWYKYMISVFNWGKAPNSTLKNAIIWVIIIIFSYAIMRSLMAIIWLL